MSTLRITSMLSVALPLLLTLTLAAEEGLHQPCEASECDASSMLQVADVVAATLAVSAVRAAYGAAALKDEVHGLPGAPAVPWRMFSGYVDVSNPGEPIGSRQMFYWFVESQKEPSADPVMLWTNGGPGCSGLGGFLTEQGPFRPGVDGKYLTLNEFSWAKVANMVFIEQPVGVGFSKTSVKIDYGDSQAAADNYRFTVGFFKRYPQYAAQAFYISSESYGGHYMPTLARQLKEGGEVPQFRGIFLGNPLTYMMYTNYGMYGTAWGHQLLPAPLWKRYGDASCATTSPPSDACTNITDAMDQILSDLDPYALDFDKCASPATSVGRHERWIMRRAISRASAALRHSSISTALLSDLASEPAYQPCIDDYMAAYLNRADVQAVIHVKSGAKWIMCSNEVFDHYNVTDQNLPMMPVWQELIKYGDLKIIIYSGDDDSVCATMGTQQWVWDQGYSSNPTWQPWNVSGQVAGFRTDFEVPSKNGLGAFTFTTVHGAGHMVPATQPARSLALLEAFLGKDAAHG